MFTFYDDSIDEKGKPQVIFDYNVGKAFVIYRIQNDFPSLLYAIYIHTVHSCISIAFIGLKS